MVNIYHKIYKVKYGEYKPQQGLEKITPRGGDNYYPHIPK